MGIFEEEFKVEGIMAVDLNPILMSSGVESEFKIRFSCSKPDLSFLKVNFETTFWLAADMMQQSCLYLEISIPTKYMVIKINLLVKYLALLSSTENSAV